MEEDYYQQTVLAVLSKRYRLRVRQIRNRRKMTHQIMIQKYVQYMHASQQLFQTYAMKVLELFEPATSPKKTDRVTESWWVHQFPNLSEEKFFNTFHVSRKFYNYLCQELRPEVKRISNKINRNFQGTPIEKQVAIGLYKLATGDSDNKTSKMVGVNHSTVHKLLLKLLTAIVEKFGDSAKMPTQDECKVLAQKTVEAINATDVIGSLLKKKFQNRATGPEKMMDLMAIVDIDKKFRFVHVETADENSTYCKEIKTICCSPSTDSSSDGCPNYFIVTDNEVPDYDYFVQKLPTETAKMDQDLDENVTELLEIKEEAFQTLIGRWNILKKDLEYLPPMANLVLNASICLHNLCIELGELPFECD